MVTLIENLREMKVRLETVRSQAKRIEDELASKRDEHAKLVNQIALDTEVSEVVKYLFDQVSKEGLGFIEQLINMALTTVFTDEEYKVRMVTGSRGAEKTIEFMLHDGTTEQPINDAIGGGVMVLISFVLRVYFILKTDMRRVIFIDEGFAQLSPQYLENLVNFMRLLNDKFGFNFLWISHSPYLSEYADKYYVMSKGKLFEKDLA